MATAKKKGLLDLPPEIWSKICKIAVSWDIPIDVILGSVPCLNIPEYTRTRDGREYRGRAPARAIMQPSITRVCRSIRKECLSHFYETNVFRIRAYDTTRWKAWLDIIGESI